MEQLVSLFHPHVSFKERNLTLESSFNVLASHFHWVTTFTFSDNCRREKLSDWRHMVKQIDADSFFRFFEKTYEFKCKEELTRVSILEEFKRLSEFMKWSSPQTRKFLIHLYKTLRVNQKIPNQNVTITSTASQDKRESRLPRNSARSSFQPPSSRMFCIKQFDIMLMGHNDVINVGIITIIYNIDCYCQ